MSAPYPKINTLFQRGLDHEMTSEYSTREFKYLSQNWWIFSEKIDGINIRVIFDSEGNLSFKGRTDDSEIPSRLMNALFSAFLPFSGGDYKNLTIYGEGCGGNIANKDYPFAERFIAFDAWTSSGRWLPHSSLYRLVSSMGVACVPLIGGGTLEDMEAHVKAGQASQLRMGYAEGIVARPARELLTARGERIIAKLKHRDYYK